MQLASLLVQAVRVVQVMQRHVGRSSEEDVRLPSRGCTLGRCSSSLTGGRI
jgi:hypothetical protein